MFHNTRYPYSAGVWCCILQGFILFWWFLMHCVHCTPLSLSSQEFPFTEVNSQAWKFGMRLSGGKFCPEFFGVCWKCYGLFWFWFLPPFDNPCHLKSRVSPPPLGFGFLCRITVSPIARAWLVKWGTGCTCPPLSFLQSVLLVFFF